MVDTELKDAAPATKRIINISLVLLALFGFLLAIEMISGAFTQVGKEATESFIQFVSNPFVSLFIGLLITAIVQSSSTVTSLIVAVVASGSLDLQNAIPMIMGANIGTTLTSTLVSMAFITKKKEFKKAISAGVVHDFFNILVTAILFPLEYYYGLLSSLTILLTDWAIPAVSSEPGGKGFQVLYLSALGNQIINLIDNIWIMAFVSFLLLFGAIKLLSQALFKLFHGEFGLRLSGHLRNPGKSFLWGLFLTASVQSSSITTSLIVPFVAAGRISLKKAFPFIIGANLGTTITAFLAALFKSELAVSIAVAHLLFNIFGVALFLPFRPVRNIPVALARKLGKLTARHRIAGFGYIILIFFLIPFLLIYFNQPG